MNKLQIINEVFGEKSRDFWNKCFCPRFTSITGEAEFDILQFEEFLILEYGYTPEMQIKEFCDKKFGQGKIELIFNI